MDLLPFNNIEQLSYYVNAVCSEKVEEKTLAMEIILKMSENATALTDSLLSIIINQQVPDETRKSASILLPKSLKERWAVMHKDKKKYIYDAVLKVISSKEISFSIKCLLQPLFSYLLESEQYEADLPKNTIAIITEKLKADSVNDHTCAFLLLKSMIDQKKQNNTRALDLWNNFQALLAQTGTSLITKIREGIQEFIASPDSKDKVTDVVDSLDSLRFWAILLKNFIKVFSAQQVKTKKLESSYIRALTSERPIVNILEEILNLQIQTPHQPLNCFFSVSGIVEADEALNKVKKCAIKCFNLVLEITFNSRTLMNFNNNRFYPYARAGGLLIILESVLVLCESPTVNKEEILKEIPLNQCLAQCLRFIGYLSSEPAVQVLSKRLFMNVCLPLMQTGPSELVIFEKEPRDFVRLALDTCDNQKTDILKTAAAQLLELICDNVHGSNEYLTKLLFATIEYSLIENNTEKIGYYPILKEYKNSWFIARTDKVIRIETCIVALTVISYLATDREEDLRGFETFLASFSENLCGVTTHPLIRSRMCLFLSFYFDLLFKNPDDEEFFAFFLRFILSCLNDQKNEIPAVAEQALDTFINIFTQENHAKLVPYIQEVINVVTSCSRTTKTLEFFEVFNEIFRFYTKSLLDNPKNLPSLVTALAERLKIEYNNKREHQEFEPTSKKIISKVWQVIFELSNSKKLIPIFRDEIENILEPLFNAYKDQKVNIQEDLCVYILNVTKLTKSVSPICLKIIKTLIGTLNQAGDIFQWLQAFNQTILYGKAEINNDPAFVHLIVDAGLIALKMSSHDEEETSLQSTLLLQLTFQHLFVISQEDWEAIVCACLEMFQLKNICFKVKLAQTILCALVQNVELTCKVVFTEDNQYKFRDFIHFCLKKPFEFEATISRKFLLRGLCALLKHELDDPIISENLVQIVSVLTSLLQSADFIEAQKGNQIITKKNNFDSDEDEEEEESDEDIDLDKACKSKKDLAIEPRKIIKQFMYDQETEKSSKSQENTNYDQDYCESGGSEDEDEEHGFKYDWDLNETDLSILQQDDDKRDDITVFKETIQYIREIHKGVIENIFLQLAPNKKKYLANIFEILLRKIVHKKIER